MTDPKLHNAIGRLEAKVDILLSSTSNQNERIGSLERWRSFLAGAWVVLAGIVAVAFKFIK